MNKMKLFTLSLSILLASFIYFYVKANNDNKMKNPILSRMLVDSKSKPTQDLLDLLSAFNVQHDGTLKDIVVQTQKEWLRKPGKERWQVDEVKVEDKEKVLELLEKLKCVGEVKPKSNDYDYALIMGATAGTMKLRISYLLNLYNKGIRFKTMVFLVGERPRDINLETQDTFLVNTNDGLKIKENWNFKDLPKTETEMAKLIFDQIDLPEEFKNNVKVIFVDTPMQPTKEGQLRRPNTGDTVIWWMKLEPKAGTCLVISNNPYVGYQDTVARTLLPKKFSIETVGSAASRNEKVSTYLDNAARWLYQEQVRQNTVVQ